MLQLQHRLLDIQWWQHISNANVLQRSGLPLISDILLNRRQSHCPPGLKCAGECCPSADGEQSWWQEAINHLDEALWSPTPHVAQPHPRRWC